jgi:hypothetical protein
VWLARKFGGLCYTESLKVSIFVLSNIYWKVLSNIYWKVLSNIYWKDMPKYLLVVYILGFVMEVFFTTLYGVCFVSMQFRIFAKSESKE